MVSKIVAAHRIANKALIGYEADSAMLGGEGNVLNVSYNLYNKTVANKMRKDIISTINKALLMNGVETEIVLKPLQFNITETEDTSTEKSAAAVDNEENNTVTEEENADRNS